MVLPHLPYLRALNVIWSLEKEFGLDGSSWWFPMRPLNVALSDRTPRDSKLHGQVDAENIQGRGYDRLRSFLRRQLKSVLLGQGTQKASVLLINEINKLKKCDHS